jgi:hypothetical protein
MGYKGLPIVERSDQELALATYTDHHPTLEPLIQLARAVVVPCSPDVCGPHIAEGAPGHGGIEMTSGDLNFRKFRQCGSTPGWVTVPALMDMTPRSFGEILSEGTTVLSRVWRKLIPPAFGAFVILGGLTIAAFASTGADELLQLILTDPQALNDMTDTELIDVALKLLQAGSIAFGFQLFATGFVGLAVHRIVAAEIAGDPISPRQASAVAFGRILPLAAAGFLALASIFLGLLAFVIPGIWLAGCFSMLSPVVALETVGPFDALRRSFALVKGRWWPTIGFLLLVGLLGSVASQLVQLIALPALTATNVDLGTGLGFVVLIVVQGLVVAAIAVMTTMWYFDLRARFEMSLSSRPT